MSSDPQSPGNEAAPTNPKNNDSNSVKPWEIILVSILGIAMIVGSVTGIVLGTRGDPQPANTGIDPITGNVVSTFQLPTAPEPTKFDSETEEYEFIRSQLASNTAAFGTILSKLPSSINGLDGASTDPIVQAAVWLTTQDETNAKEFVMTRFALASLYFSMNGANWVNNNDWLTDKNHCQWHGVECCPKLMGSVSCQYTDFYKFIQLDLFRNNLSGSIPETIGLFPDLQSIFFNENNITGKLPTHLGELPKLHRLYMQHNRMSGQIPSKAELDKSGLIGMSLQHVCLHSSSSHTILSLLFSNTRHAVPSRQ